MTTLKLALAGISLAALVAGGAEAQSSTNTRDVQQLGVDNTAAVDNSRAGNASNSATVVQNGTSNRASILQIGSFNNAEARQLGNDNYAAYSQDGDFNRAESFQTNNNNRSIIRQRDQSNSATVTQNGLRNVSQIAQGAEATATTDFDSTTFVSGAGVLRSGTRNRASVSQVGNDFTSTIRQRARAGGGPAGDDNRVTLVQRGAGNSSTIVQESRSNSAEVYQREGGASDAARNVTRITQGNSTAAAGSTVQTNNRANVAVSGTANSATVAQDGINNGAEVTQGLGQGSTVNVSQVGTAGQTRALIAQYGDANAVTVAQASAGATATVWQQAGPVGGRSRGNAVEIQQGTGTTGTAEFSRGFFGNTASVTGAATRGLVADVTQGAGSAAAGFNLAQVYQDGVDLTATIQQAGTGTASLQNIARIAQQGSGNTALAIQRSTVASGATGAATGQPGDAYYFAGGTRSAEATILQSGNGNSATIEQRGQSQLARIEQGPGSGNTASILQEASAAFATAIIRQTGSNNSYAVTQDTANAYILVSQTGNNNTVTDVVRR